MRFEIVIRGRNCAKGLPKTLRSIEKQGMRYVTVLLNLDGPQDDNPSVPVGVLRYDWPERWGVAGNLWRSLNQIADRRDDTIVCILDADGDRLAPRALRRVQKVYEQHPECMLTYGSYLKMSKRRRTRISRPYPHGADVRKYPWHASHLKTFRASMLSHIKKEWFQDDAGQWLPAASDVALMLPLMEIAGLDHCRHIHKITYYWNDAPISRRKRAIQRQCEAIVRAKPGEIP